MEEARSMACVREVAKSEQIQPKREAMRSETTSNAIGVWLPKSFGVTSCPSLFQVMVMKLWNLLHVLMGYNTLISFFWNMNVYAILLYNV